MNTLSYSIPPAKADGLLCNPLRQQLRRVLDGDAGVYVYRLKTGEWTGAKKMVVVR